MNETTVKISGMSCQHCVMRVKKSIEELPGIQDLSVEIGSAKVSFDESKTAQKNIEEAIVRAGYKIAG